MVIGIEMWETYELVGWIAVVPLSSQLNTMDLGSEKMVWQGRLVDSFGAGERPYG